MRIRLLVDMPEGAARNGQPWPAKGESVDLPTAEAAHLVASGIAEEVLEDQGEAEQESPEPRRGRRKATTEGEG